MAWRSLLKNKISSGVNIGGLAVGLTTGILIILVIVDEFSYDKFHRNLPDIYLLMKNQQQMDGVSTGSSTSGMMAAALREEMPETKYAARAAYRQELTRVGDKSIFASGVYTDPDLFNIMTFPAVEGNAVVALKGVNTVVLTEAMAKKMFGDADALGKTLVLNDTLALKVGAVLRDIPENSSIKFEMALPFAIFQRNNPWLNKWDDNRIHTWMQLQPNANVAVLNKKLTRLVQVQTNDTSVSLFAHPMAKYRLYSHFSNGKPDGGRIYLVDLLAVIGLFILLIACINFMNLATARSERRAREVGVRKVLGASRRVIIFQFFSEALLMAFLALLAGLAVVYLVLPLFNQFTEKNISLNFLDGKILLLLLGVGLFTGLVAGSYPALFLSRFRTVEVLKGTMARGKSGGGLRKALVTLQFVVSIFFIIATLVIYSQINYIRNRPLGYDQENLIDIVANGNLPGEFELFKNELSKLPGVRNVSGGSDNILQFGSGITGLDWPGKQPGHELSILTTDVQYNWTKTMGIRMVEGRDFSADFGADTSACLLNQASVDKMGLKEPVIGLKVGGKRVVGVFENFVFNNPSGIIAPMMVYLNTGRLGHFYIRIRNDAHWQQTVASIGKTAKTLNPGYPLDLSFTKESYQHRFEDFASFGFLATLFGGMAIFISCLGLFGLSAFLAERKGKEMSIRKVLGASTRAVWFALSGEFLRPVFIALLLAIPLGAWVMHAVLANIAYRVHLSWWIFAVAGVMAILIALATVSYQGLRTALENPVKKLRSE
jgi:ABC-type antimicrobial peptide transport system permease subunit